MRKVKLLLSHLYNAATDGRYRKFFYQRSIKSIPARKAYADKVRASLPAALPASDAQKAKAAELARDGFAFIDGVVTDQMVQDLRAYFTDRPVKDAYAPERGTFKPPSEAPPGVHVAFYEHDEVVAAPHALAIANHPEVLAVASAELGAKPIISYVTAWWSLPSGDGTAQHAENYHRDVDDADWTKYFIYLTDVEDVDSGPHLFIKGSHTDEKLMPIRRYSDEEVHDAFGKDREITYLAKAGTGFLEKTYGMHRGLPVTKKPRLILQVVYSLRPLVYGPKTPVAAMPEGVDPYINQVYCQ